MLFIAGIVAGVVLFGSSNTLLYKVQDKQIVKTYPDIDPETGKNITKRFIHPFM